MAYIVPNAATHAAIVTITFADAGEDEQQVLQFGSFSECDAVARGLPAISYSGPRLAKEASVSVVPLVPFCGTCGQRHEGGC